jgi:predicted nucleic acid-binding Zn ribbon protein
MYNKKRQRISAIIIAIVIIAMVVTAVVPAIFM